MLCDEADQIKPDEFLGPELGVEFSPHSVGYSAHVIGGNIICPFKALSRWFVTDLVNHDGNVGDATSVRRIPSRQAF